MLGRLFISYSRRDGQDFALALADDLEGGPEELRVWLDQRELRRGRQDWDDQLTEAIQTCEALLFVMTPDSVRSESLCKHEWSWALKYKKPVIPLRFHGDADLPFRLGSRQFIDFTNAVRGLAQLRGDLRWMRTPEGQLAELKVRLAEAERELPFADPAQQPRIEQEVEALRERIEAQARAVADPASVAEQTDARIGAGIERERRPERPVAPAAPRARFVNPPPLTAPAYFQDRRVETGLIGDFVRDDRVRLLSVVGRGGVGKTAMVCRLLKALETGRMPDDLGELDVDGIVYLSPFGVHPVDFPHVFADLCRLLPEELAEPLTERSRDPHETPASLMRALLARFPEGRWVLLLDNFEDVVDASGVGLTDVALEEALVTALRAPAHGVKVILTTRDAPRNLLLVEPSLQRRLDLEQGLPSPYAEDVLRAMDGDGSLGIKHAPDALLEEARERTRGFPRALEALVAILNADRDTTLPELLASTESMPENVVEVLVGEAFNRLDALAQQVMQALAIYPGPVPPVAVDYLLQPFEPAIDSAPVLGRLVNMQFVRRDAGRYHLHQVDRDYALRRIPEGEPSDRLADPPPFSRYALRERAAQYFRQTRTPREEWRDIDDLAPQLAEFELRCQAGDFDTAAGVLFEISDDYLQMWGHVRLALGMHERLRGRLSDPVTAATNLIAQGNAYALLGDVRRAIELYDDALEANRETGDRGVEAAGVNALGIAYAALGESRRGIEHCERGLEICLQLGDRRGESASLAGLGIAYKKLGEVEKAIGFMDRALAVDRELGDRRGEAIDLSSLGGAYDALRQVRRAIDYHEQALVIQREIKDLGGEGSALDRLGTAYSALGDERRAGDYYEQALAIYRQIGDRAAEGGALANLGEVYARLGELPRAIDMLTQGIALFRETRRREMEVLAISMLGAVYIDAGDLPRALACGEEALRMADEMEFAQARAEARLELATAHLLAGAYGPAEDAARSAQTQGFETATDNAALLLAIALLRQGRTGEARAAFEEALRAAEELLALTPDSYDELDSRALALCGLSLVEDPARAGAAEAAFDDARAITSADGVVARVLRLFDVLAVGDGAGILARVRPAAAGARMTGVAP